MKHTFTQNLLQVLPHDMRKGIEQIRGDLRTQPRDERITATRNAAAWKAMLVNFLGFFILGAYYSYKGEVMPFPLQIMFYLPLVTFFIVSIKTDGLGFSLPGMPESEATLDQPAAVRSLPWMVFITGIMQFIFKDIISAIYGYAHAGMPLAEALFRGGGSLIFGLPIAYVFSYGIKRAEPWWVIATLIASIANLFQYSLKLLRDYGVFEFAGIPKEYLFPGEVFKTSPIDFMIVLASIWTAGVILTHYKTMTKAGATLPDTITGHSAPKIGSKAYWIALLKYFVVPLIITTAVTIFILTMAERYGFISK